MSKDIKKIVTSFMKQQSLTIISYDTLKAAAKNIGYTIIEFNNNFNNEDVEIIIQNLGLREATLRSRGFTYADSDYRLIFINEELNKEEKTLILSHELGHIVCEHFTITPIIGRDVKEEHDANEFSHYLLNQSAIRKWKSLVDKHKKVTGITALLLIALVISVTVVVALKKEQSYYGNFYITSTGDKYHKKECIFVKDKKTISRLSEEEYETGAYTACNMCLPDE